MVSLHHGRASWPRNFVFVLVVFSERVWPSHANVATHSNSIAGEAWECLWSKFFFFFFFPRLGFRAFFACWNECQANQNILTAAEELSSFFVPCSVLCMVASWLELLCLLLPKPIILKNIRDWLPWASGTRTCQGTWAWRSVFSTFGCAFFWFVLDSGCTGSLCWKSGSILGSAAAGSCCLSSETLEYAWDPCLESQNAKTCFQGWRKNCCSESRSSEGPSENWSPKLKQNGRCCIRRSFYKGDD